MSSSAVRLSTVETPVYVPRTVVHKFGGTSVADADCYRHVTRLLLAREETVQVTIVSAMKGVTDTLIALAEQAANHSPRLAGVVAANPHASLRRRSGIAWRACRYAARLVEYPF